MTPADVLAAVEHLEAEGRPVTLSAILAETGGNRRALGKLMARILGPPTVPVPSLRAKLQAAIQGPEGRSPPPEAPD